MTALMCSLGTAFVLSIVYYMILLRDQKKFDETENAFKKRISELETRINTLNLDLTKFLSPIDKMINDTILSYYNTKIKIRRDSRYLSGGKRVITDDEFNNYTKEISKSILELISDEFINTSLLFFKDREKFIDYIVAKCYYLLFEITLKTNSSEFNTTAKKVEQAREPVNITKL